MTPIANLRCPKCGTSRSDYQRCKQVFYGLPPMENPLCPMPSLAPQDAKMPGFSPLADKTTDRPKHGDLLHWLDAGATSFMDAIIKLDAATDEIRRLRAEADAMRSERDSWRRAAGSASLHAPPALPSQAAYNKLLLVMARQWRDFLRDNPAAPACGWEYAMALALEPLKDV